MVKYSLVWQCKGVLRDNEKWCDDKESWLEHVKRQSRYIIICIIWFHLKRVCEFMCAYMDVKVEIFEYCG